jgi:hypothetical protein
MKQLDLFEKRARSPVIPDKYKYHSRPKQCHGNLVGLANDNHMQYYHFPSLMSICQCGQDLKVYYRPDKPKLGTEYGRFTLMEKPEYEIYHCPKCGRRMYLANGKIILIEVVNG